MTRKKAEPEKISTTQEPSDCITQHSLFVKQLRDKNYFPTIEAKDCKERSKLVSKLSFFDLMFIAENQEGMSKEKHSSPRPGISNLVNFAQNFGNHSNGLC